MLRHTQRYICMQKENGEFIPWKDASLRALEAMSLEATLPQLPLPTTVTLDLEIATSSLVVLLKGTAVSSSGTSKAGAMNIARENERGLCGRETGNGRKRGIIGKQREERRERI